MKITAIDNRNDLFFLENIIDDDLIKEFNRENINLYKWKLQEWQESVPRHVLTAHSGSVLARIKTQLLNIPKQLNAVLGTSFRTITVNCWHDLEKFEFKTHIDNPAVQTVMQLYIGEASEDLGTVFYNAQDQDVEDKEDKQKWHLVNHNLPVRRNFKYIPNTGYLMFNNRTQAHGVVGEVTHNDKRVSCYCYIN